ncbi:MAG: maleate cis-trans isomerase [Thermococci archaeon]|nr:maleate cis-trans isomerase [Thermococci archaeon]
MYGWRARIGLLVPSSNTTMEPELWKMAPEGVSLHAARMRLTEVIEAGLREMERQAGAAAETLVDAGVDVILYGCTSGSLIGGRGYDVRVAEDLEDRSGVRSITTSTAVLEALNELGIRRLSVATPYTDEVNEKERLFLEENGFEVVRMEGLGLVNNLEIGMQEPRSAYRLARSVYAPGIDAVFISCTNFRTVEVIDRLEEDLGVPVVTSNQASLWFVLRELGVRSRYGKYGELMREHL